MTIEDFKSNPQVIEHWPQVSGHVEELLIEHLISTCRNAKGGDAAQTEVGAQKAIANMVILLRDAGGKPTVRKRMLTTKPLHRNNPGEKPPAEPTTTLK